MLEWFYHQHRVSRPEDCGTGSLGMTSDIADRESNAQEWIGEATPQWGALKTKDDMQTTRSFPKAGTIPKTPGS